MSLSSFSSGASASSFEAKTNLAKTDRHVF